VPCSTSNLGAGFDCVGLAFDRYLEVEFEPSPEPLRIERAGTLASLDSPVDDDAVVRALRAGLQSHGISYAGGVLRMTSAIPVARGLGSSAAATVAGLMLASATLGEDPNRPLLLASATAIEGHPDNAAPALFGGLVGIAMNEHGQPRAFRLPLSERIGFGYAAPATEVSTTRARKVLPKTVPYNTAVSALSRVAALLHGLATGDAESLRTGFQDELHVPYRLPLIPGAREAMDAAQQAGAIAVTISGSGSGLIAVCETTKVTEVCDAMKVVFDETGESLAFPLKPAAGAQLS
jgi:homoserine kinase